LSRECAKIANSSVLFVELVLQAREPKDLACVFKRDESHFVQVGEMG
jgi:hypothetical protein